MQQLMKNIDRIAFILIIVGGLNWGFVGFFDFNLVTWAIGTGLLAKTIYSLVGIAAIYSIVAYPWINDRRSLHINDNSNDRMPKAA